MVAATVSPGSSRLRWPARALLRPGYGAVTAAAVISAEDGGRLARLGVPPAHIRVLGDPRFDSVAEKVRATSPTDPLLDFGQGASTMVAGSTWPEDEAVLLRAFVGVRGAHPEARLILVPHEPGEEHLPLDRADRRYDGPAPPGSPQRDQGCGAASAGGPGWYARVPLRCRVHGLCGRWLWPGRASLRPGAGCVGHPSRVWAPLAQQPGCGAAA